MPNRQLELFPVPPAEKRVHKYPGLTASSTLHKALQAYHAHMLKQELSHHTVKAFDSDLRLLARFLGARKLVGDIHTSQADAQSVQCQTCHGTLAEPPELVAVTEPDDPAIRRARLNPHYTLEVGDVAVLAPDGDAMGAVQFVDGQLVQFAKAREEVWPVPLVQGSACEQQPDQQESRYCHECHAYDPQRS